MRSGSGNALPVKCKRKCGFGRIDCLSKVIGLEFNLRSEK